MQFELPKEKPSIIKVIGVGGGGSNAVNHMYRQGIKGVDFIVCNTDHQALEISPVPLKIQLGPTLTEGRGAGSIPEIGKNAAIENIEQIRDILGKETKMAFITAGMGGGTGTGAAPIIAGVAKEMGILTVGICTVPFSFEGKKRKLQADLGIEELKRNVDTLLIICNDKLREIYGNLKLSEAFGHADDVLTTAAKSIAEIITVTLHMNVDFADIQTVMCNSGVAIMGSAFASGENRAIRAVEQALDSPLLNDNSIEGARYILLNITSGTTEITMDEMGEINEYVQDQAGQTAEIILGQGTDESLGEQIGVTIIATGFKTKNEQVIEKKSSDRKVYQLHDEQPVTEVKPEAVKEVEATVMTAPKVDLKPELEPQLKSEIVPAVVAEETVQPVYELPKQEDTFTETDLFAVAEPKLIRLESPVETKTFLFDIPVVNAEEKETQPVASVVPPAPVQAPEFIQAAVPVVTATAVPVSAPAQAPAPARTPEAPKFETEAVKEQHTEITKAEPTPGDDPFLRSRERIMKLRDLSYKMNTPAGISDLEREPAYKRRNIKLDNVTPSSESEISRYSLTEDNNKTEIRSNNSFLHDRVD